ncbi:MAG: CHASE3 domain-containing protein [Novosphingobium sp.]
MLHRGAPPSARTADTLPGPRGAAGAARAISFALFALVSVALLAAVALLISTVRAEQEARERVARTSQTMLALRDVGRAAINAETGQRGYLITLGRGYLQPYRLGVARYPLVLRQLRRLLGQGATPRQRELVDKVERIADAKFAEMARTVQLIEAGRVLDAEQAVRGDEGRMLMERLRRTLGELETIERAELDEALRRTGAIEARIVPLLSALAVIALVAFALGVWQFVRAARAEAAAAQAPALRESRDRADLLARELNHRVKNIFAVILAIVRMSARGAPEAKPAIDRITARIDALVRAHDMSQGSGDGTAVDLRELIETAITPYRSDGERCLIEGEGVLLSGRVAMPLGLVVHELVTNAVKHGAWSRPDGEVRVRWARSGAALRIDWREHGDGPPRGDGRPGFGSALIRSSARQLDGTIERTFEPEGLAVRIEFPLPAG